MLVNAMKIQTYGNEFLLGLRVVLPVLVGNILRFFNHCFYYEEDCPIVNGFVHLPIFMDTHLFVAIALSCFNIWI